MNFKKSFSKILNYLSYKGSVREKGKGGIGLRRKIIDGDRY